MHFTDVQRVEFVKSVVDKLWIHLDTLDRPKWNIPAWSRILNMLLFDK